MSWRAQTNQPSVFISGLKAQAVVMNPGLFEALEAEQIRQSAPPPKAVQIKLTPAALAYRSLQSELPQHLYLGTSSWTFPGWAGLVWDEPYSETLLAKHGLRAYSQHPLLRTVCLDRAFYRPMTDAQYAQLAAQVSDDFRFVVKVPSLISDALVRSKHREHAGRGMHMNPWFLNAQMMQEQCVQPLVHGLGAKLGALVLQVSPLPASMLSRAGILSLFSQIAVLFSASSAIKSGVNDAVWALELRNPELISGSVQNELTAMLRDCGATYCLSGHAKMPPMDEQLPILRQLWPGPLVARWILHGKHGRFGYEAAKSQYEPFDQLVDEDVQTRSTLAKVIAATIKHSQKAFVTINNKAEGSAPLSVAQLAQAVAAQL